MPLLADSLIEKNPLQQISSNILPKSYRKYKITTTYEKAIDFFSPNTNPITFNLAFSSYSGDNQEEKSPEMRKAYVKKAKIKAEKKAEAQAKKEARKAKTIAKKAIQVQNRETKKGKAIAKKAKTVAKKALNKEKKRVKVEKVSRKKLDDKIAKNMKIVLEKIQSATRKSSLSFNDPSPKKQ